MRTCTRSPNPMHALTACLGLAAPAVAAPMPQSSNEIKVTGMVRDFKKEHVDFDVTPSGGNGHYAGNIALTISNDRRPSFTTAGYKVATQWRDKDSNPLPPHLALVVDNKLYLVNAPTLTNASTMDTYDSELGPYGGSNVGPAPVPVTGSAMPTITLPSPLPPKIGEALWDGPGTTNVLASSYTNGILNCDKFLVKNNRKLNIYGNLTIVCHEEFKIQDGLTEVRLGDANATLTIYALKDFTVQDGAKLNPDTSAVDRVILYRTGNLDFKVQNSAMMCATVIAPDARLYMQDYGNFYGRYIGKNLHLQNTSKVHLDVDSPPLYCGVATNDALGTKGVNSTGGVSSATTFNQWYRDTLGANLSAQHIITLVKNNSGVYEYLDNAFFPIDGRLFGNEGDAHNYFFTFTFSVPFVHDECAGKFFEFEGADDAWLFVDDDLAMDLGGILPGTLQYVPMDRLNLADGQTYTLRFFYAQRNPTSAVFRVRTNLDLVVDTPPQAVSAAWD